ncbi:hypothetical protein OOT46_16025 [Aquabacterium sp. A7-Y]|uniref:hypothetical protein n=1 Tax=Aquabacterium sp. A7-Y TaxID=1349605 RepID=UPI00223E527D|nr:hypothetical protein [Aquabacterium sp. A7-Y]MCW7539353.1 hypothetical protein [Aquabacterium sp. A7-Y]
MKPTFASACAVVLSLLPTPALSAADNGVSREPAAPASAEADSGPQLWVTSGFVSHHTRHADRYRSANTGIGVEWHVSRRWQLNAGHYTNSVNGASNYVQAGWAPLSLDLGERTRLRAGASLGVVNGYRSVRDGGYFPTLVPMLALEHRRIGANLVYIPSLGNRVDGAFALQVKARLY